MKKYPYVTGTFFQFPRFCTYTAEQWNRHCDYLLEVGIDKIIVQWTSDTPYGLFKDAYYPAQLTDDEKAQGYTEYPDSLENLLSVCEKRGLRVFVGLNNADEWWSLALNDFDWCKKQADVGIRSMKTIYSLYKQKYPNAFYGWYFVWEMYNGLNDKEDEAGAFLNFYLDAMTELDSSMPMMLSPFVRTSGGDAISAEVCWKKVFETARFRKGDVFCCQDAVGAGHIEIDMLDDYFKALKNACDTVDGLVFWANNENFTLTMLPDNKYNIVSAPVDRFVRQMKIAEKYVSGFVTFAYSHYYAPDTSDADFHKKYKRYYETGEI